MRDCQTATDRRREKKLDSETQSGNEERGQTACVERMRAFMCVC